VNKTTAPRGPRHYRKRSGPVRLLSAAELRSLRAEAGISQRELARRCGLSAISVSRWEREEQPISRHAVQRLLDELKRAIAEARTLRSTAEELLAS